MLTFAGDDAGASVLSTVASTTAASRLVAAPTPGVTGRVPALPFGA
jgi:hypothetical protein